MPYWNGLLEDIRSKLIKMNKISDSHRNKYLNFISNLEHKEKQLIEIIDISPLVSGSAQPKLTAEALKNLKISFPLDLEERKAIDIFIKHQKVKFDFRWCFKKYAETKQVEF